MLHLHVFHHLTPVLIPSKGKIDLVCLVFVCMYESIISIEKRTEHSRAEMLESNEVKLEGKKSGQQAEKERDTQKKNSI